MSMGLLSQGFDANSTKEEEVQAAADALIELKPNLILVRLVRNGGYARVRRSLSYARLEWSSIEGSKSYQDVQYVIPKEGALVWADTMCIPKDAPHKYTAEVLINYLLRPEIANMTGHYLQYGTGNQAALEIADKDYRENTIINIPLDAMKNLSWLSDLGESRDLYDRLWQRKSIPIIILID